jgi:CheY-like chemotaxis protein
MLVVSDTGNGMDGRTLEHLFEPFYSTKGEKGTGLGLATVYGIIKQHEGNIWVYSEKGIGTTFKIYLPVPPKSKIQFDAAEAGLGEFDGTETILIAEDNESVRILAHDILKRCGYKILLAENGIAALKALRSYGDSVDLLLTDVIMPEMNGKALFAQAATQIPNLKVLYMSGYTDDIILNHGVLEKGAPLIQKPFSANALSSKVRKILDEP